MTAAARKAISNTVLAYKCFFGLVLFIVLHILPFPDYLVDIIQGPPRNRLPTFRKPAGMSVTK